MVDYNAMDVFGKKEEMITLYHASPNMPTKGNWKKGTYFADTEQNARYYAESHHRGDITVVQVKIPKKLLEKRSDGHAYILSEEYPIRSIGDIKWEN